MKKILSLIVSLALIFALCIPASAAAPTAAELEDVMATFTFARFSASEEALLFDKDTAPNPDVVTYLLEYVHFSWDQDESLMQYATPAYEGATDFYDWDVPYDVFTGLIPTLFAVAPDMTQADDYNADTNSFVFSTGGGMGDSRGYRMRGYSALDNDEYAVYTALTDYTTYDPENLPDGVEGEDWVLLDDETIELFFGYFKLTVRSTEDGYQYLAFEQVADLSEMANPAQSFSQGAGDVHLYAEAGVIAPGTTLTVEPVEADSEEAVLIETALDGSEESYCAFDITLENNGVAVQPDGSVRITLYLPAEFDHTICRVYRIDADGSRHYTPILYGYSDGENMGYITFAVDHFSLYVVGENADYPATGDVDGDGAIDVADIVKIKSLILTETGDAYPAADADASGKVDVADIIQLKSIILQQN